MADYVTAVRTSDGDKNISAAKLNTTSTFLTNLGSTSIASFNGTKDTEKVRPGVTGTLPVDNGGTGKKEWTANYLVYPSSSTKLTQMTKPPTDGAILRQNQSGAPYWSTITDLGIGREWTLIDTLINGSGTYKAPKLYGEENYDLGVYMIGGGGSGAAGCVGNADADKTVKVYAQGGASGYGKNVVFLNVAPNTEYKYVVGVGGAAVTASYSHSSSAKIYYSIVDGKTGGTTSFGEKAAEGGQGGHSAYIIPWYNEDEGTGSELSMDMALGGQNNMPDFSGTHRGFYGCVMTKEFNSDEWIFSQLPREGQNQFDTTMITLACGFNANGSHEYNTNKNPAHTASVSRAYAKTGVGPTKGYVGYSAASSESTSLTNTNTPTSGCGGGAAVVATDRKSATATSAPGGDGVILIYARRR